VFIGKFLRTPYGYSKQLFEQSKGGELTASKTEVEQHLKSVYSHTEAEQREAVALPSMKRPTAPGYAFDMSDITIEVVQYVVAKARTASAPGMNGLSYKLYKKCERVVAMLRVYQYLRTEGRRTRFSRVSGTCQHDLEHNPGCKEWKA